MKDILKEIEKTLYSIEDELKPVENIKNELGKKMDELDDLELTRKDYHKKFSDLVYEYDEKVDKEFYNVLDNLKEYDDKLVNLKKKTYNYLYKKTNDKNLSKSLADNLFEFKRILRVENYSDMFEIINLTKDHYLRTIPEGFIMARSGNIDNFDLDKWIEFRLSVDKK